MLVDEGVDLGDRPGAANAGAKIEVRITAATGQVKLVRYVIRRGKPPKASYLCATPGAKLAACA